MQYQAILRILGLLLMLSSITMLPPSIVSLWYQDGTTAPFFLAFSLSLVAGCLVWWPVRSYQRELRVRDGFVVVIMFWVVLGLSGSLPLVLSEQPDMSFTDAVFESVSGLTTTGATVIIGLDALPESILYYRQQLQWLGGMGIIVLAVAVLPMLGVGGMQLYRAETPGPMKDDKLTPRIAETAKALWYIYLGLTIACAVAYWLAGMSLFDAIGHSFSTVAIGGFSTHDMSIGHFQSVQIEIVATIFMILAGINFALHFVAWRSLRLSHYFTDPEVRAYLIFLLLFSSIVVAYLYRDGFFTTFDEALVHGIFQTVSIATTTGFSTANYPSWPIFIIFLLLMASFIGGCAGSAGGGMKVIRILLLMMQGVREIKRLIHPNAVFMVKVGGKVLPSRVIEAVWGFFSLYVACFCIISLLLIFNGLDFVTALSAVAACMNNLGPGLGDVGANYNTLDASSKWLLCFAMLLGRLEIFTLLVLLTPIFWRG